MSPVTASTYLAPVPPLFELGQEFELPLPGLFLFFQRLEPFLFVLEYRLGDGLLFRGAVVVVHQCVELSGPHEELVQLVWVTLEQERLGRVLVQNLSSEAEKYT